MTAPERAVTPGAMREAIENLVDELGHDAVVEMRAQVRRINASRCGNPECDKPLDVAPGSRRQTCDERCRQAKRRADLEPDRDATDRDGPRP